MNKIIIIVLIVLIIVGLGIYFVYENNYRQNNLNENYSTSSSDSSDNQDTSGTTYTIATTTRSQSVDTIPKQETVTINIKDFSFNPSIITVKVGTKVVWVNNDTVSHTITSDSGTLLNSSAISPGQSFSFTFMSLGSANYHCSIHPNMKGVIIVK